MASSPEAGSLLDPFQLCGTTIEGKYRVASVVGDGGFGVVYRGVHKGFGELIAVKCLKIGGELDLDKREALLEQLRDEGRLLHRLSKVTSGIVQALDVGAMTAPSGAWVPYLVLEWLEGETLGEHLSARLGRGEPPYALVDAIRLLEPAARALAVAHQQKIAHRDVKPPNLFVTDVGGVRTLKVLDFGIAKVITETTAQLEATRQGPSAFTPRYGAPEQFNKQRGASGPWTDVFALALILVEIATGKKALDGDDPTQLYIASADPSRRPTVRARGGQASDEVEAVLKRALAIDPRERYSDAGEFWDALLDAAGMPRAPRTSAPSLASLASDATRTSGPETQLEGKRAAQSGPQTVLGATMPAESAFASDREVSGSLPRVVQNPDATPPRSVTEKVAGDAMSETPMHARLPPADPTSRKTELTLLPNVGVVFRGPSEVPAQPRSRALPIAAGVIALGAAGLYFFVRAGGGEETRSTRDYTMQRGSARASAKPKKAAEPAARVTTTPAKAAISAAATVTASATASALPVAPPEDMIVVATGKYAIGEGDTARQITLTHPFFLDKMEVSTRAYLDCVAARKCGAADRVTAPEAAPPPPPDPSASPSATAPAAPTSNEFVETWSRRCNAPRKALDHPINCVDFRSADAFCKFKNKRLPTEAEWEVAARGHEARPFAWGDGAPECGRSCYDKNGGCADGEVTTCASGVHPADKTPEGLYDMGGNVAEWVIDGFATPPPGGSDPLGEPRGPKRVVRGGSFVEGADHLRASFRQGLAASTSSVGIGFRCASDAGEK